MEKVSFSTFCFLKAPLLDNKDACTKRYSLPNSFNSLQKTKLLFIYVLHIKALHIFCENYRDILSTPLVPIIPRICRVNWHICPQFFARRLRLLVSCSHQTHRERNLLQIDSGKQLIEYLDNFHYFMDLIYNCFDM